MNKEKINNITPFEVDISKWYSDIVLKSDLISYAPVKGTMFFKPYGFSIWNNISKLMNEEFEKLEIQQVQFPLLFPESFLKKEKDHIKGFAPEVLTVTRVGNKELSEPYVIRPTSETLFGTYFKENLNSYLQLPLLLNQWVNVMRWENNTRPFLRNSEFFWQEGHTVHATSMEAKEFSKKIHKLYADFSMNVCLLPIILGEKTILERFAGAENTYTIETILKDGQFLQSGTSHYLGNKFGIAFDVKVQGKDNKMYFPYQTSWGVSTRIIGAIIMSHSDNKGLIIPSKLSPIQVVILTLFANTDKIVLDNANKINELLKSNFRTKIDFSDKGIGFKSQEWEVKGVPIRIEIGPRDIKEGIIIISIRNQDVKKKIKLNDLSIDLINDLIKEYDNEILRKAIKNQKDKKVNITSIDQIKNVVENQKYAVGPWIEDSDLEISIKENTSATIRCLIDIEESESINGKGKTTKAAVFARAY